MIKLMAVCTKQESYFHIRDHFVCALSQWETMLHCNFVSHWLGSHTKWSLHMLPCTYHYHIQRDVMPGLHWMCMFWAITMTNTCDVLKHNLSHPHIHSLFVLWPYLNRTYQNQNIHFEKISYEYYSVDFYLWLMQWPLADVVVILN